MKLNMLAVLVGFIMDCILGDPAGLPHPVCLIGKSISFLERRLRALFPKTDGWTAAAGAVMAAVVLLLSGGAPLGVLYLCARVSKWLYFAVSCVMCWQCIAARCLRQEAGKVQMLLEREDLPAARRQVGMLVGRDTGSLSVQQVAKAAVETVAENTSDGVIAPLFWMLLGGPAAGIVYKAVNTMDSMVGYRNERYRCFGRFTARLDDLANLLPSRLAGLGMVAGAALAGFDGKNALRIWRRDRRRHASPNSAQTESACAGALHIRLGGSAFYFGKLYEKPFIGDPDRPIEAADIARSCRLMYADSILLLTLFELAGLAAAFLI